MQTNLEKLKSFLNQKGIATEVVYKVFGLSIDALDEAQAWYIKDEIERLLKVQFDQDRFEEICIQHGWTEDQIAITRVEHDLKINRSDMGGLI